MATAIPVMSAFELPGLTRAINGSEDILRERRV